jgi:hypothetical protein
MRATARWQARCHASLQATIAGSDESAMNPEWILEKSAKKYVIEVIFTRSVGIASVSAHREAI